MNEQAEGTTLHQEAFEYAKKLIKDGRVVVDEFGEWHAMEPTAEQEDEFIREHGYREYGLWFLGVDYDHPEDTKERYKFPYGDFKDIVRSGCIASEARAGQYKYFRIEEAARALKDMLDVIKRDQAAS